MLEKEAMKALHACKTSDLNFLQNLQEENIVLSASDDIEASCAHYAVRSGKTEILDFIFGLDNSSEVWTRRSIFGTTALHDACVLGNRAVVEWLLGNTNCSIEEQDNDGMTPVHLAARFGHIKLLQWLVVEKKTNLIAKSTSGATLLHLAAASGQLETVKFLVENSNSTRVRDEDLLESGVMWVLAVDRSVEEHTNEGHNDRSCPCCNHDHMVNAQMQSGVTAAYLATQGGHLEVLQYLVLEAGASTKIIAYDGMTMLHAAAQNGHLHVMKWLVGTQNVSLNSKDFDGLTALHFAASGGNSDVVEWLINEGAKINTDFVGGSPLHSAAQFGEIECCRVLLEKGLDPDARDDEGLTSIELADRCFQYGCAGFLTKWKKDNEASLRLEQDRIEQVRIAHELLSADESMSIYVTKFIDIPPPPAFSPPSVPKLMRQQGLDTSTLEDLITDTSSQGSKERSREVSPYSSYASTPTSSRHNTLRPPLVRARETKATRPPLMRECNTESLRAPANDTDDGTSVISQLKAIPELRSSLRKTKTNGGGQSILFAAKSICNKSQTARNNVS